MSRMNDFTALCMVLSVWCIQILQPIDNSEEYKCPSCGFTEEKQVHEESLALEAKYTCPSCGKEGESTAPYKRKSFMGVQAYVVECCNCNAKIPVTKKMKAVKKK